MSLLFSTYQSCSYHTTAKERSFQKSDFSLKVSSCLDCAMELATHLAGFLLVAQYATCLSVTGSLDLSHFLHRSVNTHLPNDKAVDCRQKFKTDVWTGCDDVLAQFQLTLKEFMLANPTIGDACDGFVPGETYCVG